MTMGFVERQAQSLADILSKTQEISRLWSPAGPEPQEMWFRGQSRRKYKLLPGLYRPSNAPFHYDEESLFERFRIRGTPFVTRTVKSDWDWYVLAQHHRLVTRLLDWTTNLLAACYFALSKSLRTEDRRDHDLAVRRPLDDPVYDDDSPVVWILEAGSLNAFACNDISEDYVICPGGDVTKKYLPSEIAGSECEDNRYPLAINPSHSNSRIAAQRGVFTVHGHDKTPIDELVDTVGRIPIKLARIVIDRANCHKLWDELERTGVDQLSMFPELDSVAHQTNWAGQYAKADEEGGGSDGEAEDDARQEEVGGETRQEEVGGETRQEEVTPRHAKVDPAGS